MNYPQFIVLYNMAHKLPNWVQVGIVSLCANYQPFSECFRVLTDLDDPKFKPGRDINPPV